MTLPLLPQLAMLLLLAKATLVLLAALGIARALHRAPAGTRHLVWLAALGALLLVPALAAWGPLRLAVLPVESAPCCSVHPQMTQMTQIEPVPLSSSVSSVSSVDKTSSTIARPSVSIGEAALALWALVALAIVATVARAWLAARRIVRRARPLDDAAWVGPLWEVADRLGLDEAPRLLRSDDARMPFACGLRAPTIVLPAESDAWSADRRRAVLLHELAHVRRRDLASHTLARLVCAAYWFHPLVWTAAKRLRAESERACDDLALTCGARAADYAEHLLDIVTSVRRDTTTPLVALAMARRSEFEGRMLDILDPERPRGVPARRQALSLVGALAVVTFLVGAATPAPAASRLDTSRTQRSQTSQSVAAETPAPRHPERSEGPAVKKSTAPSATSALSAFKNAHSQVAARTDSIPQPTVTRAAIGSDGRLYSLDRIREIVRESRAASRDASREANAAATAQTDDRAEALAHVLRTDTSATLRRVAAWGLAGRTGAPAASAALAAAVRGDASARVREMAAWALSEGGGAAGRDALVAALHDDADADVRASAAWALGTVGARSASDALTDATHDASAEVRRAALWALGNVQAPHATREMLAVLRDGDATTRRLAAWSLYQIRDPASVPALRDALRAESNAALRVAYIRALAALGERSVDALTDLLASNDASVRDAAVHALAGRSALGVWVWPWPRPRPTP